MRDIKVLAVILNYATYEMTLQFIKELKTINTDGIQFDVLVVDNFSSNEVVEQLKSHSETENYIFISNLKNSGYAAGNNIGIRYSIEHGYDYTWILNNDLHIVDSLVLKKMLAVLEKDKTIGCIGPKILSIEGEVCAPYCLRPNVLLMTIGCVFDKMYRKSQMDIARYVYRVYGCCMLLNNSVMNRIDCMDERTFLYCEEDILAERMLKVGKVSYYCPDTSIVHLESITVKRTHGSKKINKIKMVLDSYEIYLKDYRGYGKLLRSICKFFRAVIMYVRN
jgi:hypothetical protein